MKGQRALLLPQRVKEEQGSSEKHFWAMKTAAFFGGVRNQYKIKNLLQKTQNMSKLSFNFRGGLMCVKCAYFGPYAFFDSRYHRV